MSFHGGFVGVLLAMWYFAHKYKKHPLRYWILSHPVYQQAYFWANWEFHQWRALGTNLIR